MSRSPDSVRLLDAWETALSQPAVFRAPALLASLGWVSTDAAAGGATIGETDRRLFELHDILFGPDLDCVSTCRCCGQIVEFSTTSHDLMPAAVAVDPPPIAVAEGAVLCRLPVNTDLAELSRDGRPVDSRLLLRRCAINDDAPLSALSDEQCDRALSELAAVDPGACIEIEIECSCAHRWVDEFDIRSYLLSELTDWAVRTLRDVHQLASRYGWSEAAILRMSPWRKRIYLDAGGSP
jgi:hypothetical protein